MNYRYRFVDIGKSLLAVDININLVTQNHHLSTLIDELAISKNNVPRFLKKQLLLTLYKVI